MRDILKPAVSLLIICIFITFSVALVYNVTAETIAEREWEALNIAMNEVLPGGAPFEDITEAFPGISDSGGTIKITGAFRSEKGYVFNMIAPGYGGDVAVIIGIDENASISGLRLGSNNETPSLGKRAEEEFFTSRFFGINTSENIGDSVDSISGVTITSTAVKKAAQKACEYYNEYKGGGR
ncbi:MAG: FMN-binding protein [Clostridia bacterium]|nr:FMN-binding protein [Clostridia bacterium]